MIAVFIRSQEEFDMIFKQSTPNLFRWIRNIQDVRGYKFSGVVLADGWWRVWDRSQLQNTEYALQELKRRQPEIFHKQK